MKYDPTKKEEWLNYVRKLDETDEDEATFTIYKIVNNLMHAGRWEEIDEMLAMLDPHTENLDVLVAFLFITTPGRDHQLPSRANLHIQCYWRLKPILTTWGCLDKIVGIMK